MDNERRGRTYMMIDRAKHLLGRNEQRRHLPDRELEIHLRELEEPVKIS